MLSRHTCSQCGYTEIPGEKWLPVVGYEDSYEVSDHGRVRSLARECPAKIPGQTRTVPAKMLTPYQHGRKHFYVTLSRGGAIKKHKVHRLVLAAFVGPCPEGQFALHWNDDRTDNTLANLRYGTHSENMRDRLRNGNDPNGSRTRCRAGHEYTPENTSWQLNPGDRPYRKCKVCDREAKRRSYKPVDVSRHEDDYGDEQ